MLRRGGQPLLMARRAAAAAAQRPRLNRSTPVNGRLRLAPLRHRRLSTAPPPAGGREPPPPAVAAEEAGAKAAAEGAAPPLPEVPVLEAPAGACVEMYDVLRAWTHVSVPFSRSRPFLSSQSQGSIKTHAQRRHLRVLPRGGHRLRGRDGLPGGQLRGPGPQRPLAQPQARVRRFHRRIQLHRITLIGVGRLYSRLSRLPANRIDRH